MKNSLKHIQEEKARIESSNMTLNDYIKCDRSGSMFQMSRADRKAMYENYKQWEMFYLRNESKQKKAFAVLSDKGNSCYDKICFERDFESLLTA